METLRRRSRRVIIGTVGGIVVVAGIIMIPYPGPGWLVVFAGLAILAQEFTWAQRVLDVSKSKYDRWQQWLLRQAFWVKASVWILTCVIVVATIWLLNGYGFINNWLHLHRNWVNSPIFG